MKKLRFLATGVAVCLLSGCARAPLLPPPTEATLPPLSTETEAPEQPLFMVSRSGRILETLWHFYAEERFLCYGGNEPLVKNGPGELNLEDKEAALAPFSVPGGKISAVEEGATLLHLLNPKLFTCAVLQLDSMESVKSFAKAWRENIHRKPWRGGKPERLLLMELDSRHILLVMGKQKKVAGMENAAGKVFADSKVLYRESIAG